MDQPNRHARQTHTADAVGAEEPRSEVWLRWLRRGTLGAFIISLVAHLLGGFLAAFILVGGAGGAGGGGSNDRKGNGSVEFAVMTEGELAALQEASSPAGVPLVPETAVEPGTDNTSMDTLGGAFGEGEGVSELGSDSIGGGDVSGGGGEGLGLSGSGGGGGASFFGVEAQGSRFAYIVDISGSMNMEGRIDALKRELTKSVNSLLENAAFFVVLFSSDAQLLGGRKDWAEGTDANKRWADRTIARIAAQGETNPLPAFRMVLTMKPRPDAIYFMTDGDFGPQADMVALEIAALNAERKAPIHCLCFMYKDSEAVMKRIAKESGGTYHFIPGPHP